MENRKLRDQERKLIDEEEAVTKAEADDGVCLKGRTECQTSAAVVSQWGRKAVVTMILTLLTSSQGILIAWSKRKTQRYDYSVTSANCMVEVLKCCISLLALVRTWVTEGVSEDNNLSTTWDELKVYPIPAALYLIKNLLQYYIFLYVEAPAYQILKNLNIISTGLLYWMFLKKTLSTTQWAAFALLTVGCTTAQLNSVSYYVFDTPMEGWMIAVVMALLSGAAGIYTEVIMKARPLRNVNVQNFWLYVFGVLFNVFAMVTQDFDQIADRGVFYGYTWTVVIMIINHALSGLAVSMVMKYADNIVKVYATSVAMLLTALVSKIFFSYKLSLPFVVGTLMVSTAVFLHSQSKGTQ